MSLSKSEQLISSIYQHFVDSGLDHFDVVEALPYYSYLLNGFSQVVNGLNVIDVGLLRVDNDTLVFSDPVTNFDSCWPDSSDVSYLFVNTVLHVYKCLSFDEVKYLVVSDNCFCATDDSSLVDNSLLQDSFKFRLGLI